MKMSKILHDVTLKEPIKPDHFEAVAKHTNPNLPLVPVKDRFLQVPEFPNHHPDLIKSLGERIHKFKVELAITDKEFLMNAYKVAIEVDTDHRKAVRKSDEINQQELASVGRENREDANVAHRLDEAWRQRIILEKMFQSLKRLSLDEFKKQMHEAFQLADERRWSQQKLFKMQAKRDQASLIDVLVKTPTELSKEAHDRMLVESKIKTYELFEDIRLKMAEQNATLIMAQMTYKKAV